MLETVVVYIVTGKVLKKTENLVQNISEGACKKLGESIMTYLLKKFPKLGMQIEEAKKNPKGADIKNLANKLEIFAEEDQKLNELIVSLRKELKKQGASLTIDNDNRKIIMGDDNSNSYTAYGDQYINSTISNDGVKKNLD